MARDCNSKRMRAAYLAGMERTESEITPALTAEGRVNASALFANALAAVLMRRRWDGRQTATPLPNPLPTPASWGEGEDGVGAAGCAESIVAQVVDFSVIAGFRLPFSTAVV